MITADSYTRAHEQRFYREVGRAHAQRVERALKARANRTPAFHPADLEKPLMLPSEPAPPRDWLHIATPAEDTYAVLDRIAAKHGLTREQLLHDTHKHRFAHARQEAMAELYGDGSRFSLPALGRLFGKDHSTILYGIRAFNRRQRNAQAVDARETSADA